MRLWVCREEVKVLAIACRFYGSVLSCQFPIASFKCKNELNPLEYLTQVDWVAYAVGPESFSDRRRGVKKRWMFRAVSAVFCGGIAILGAGQASGQATTEQPTITTTPEVLNFAELAERGKALLEKARAGSGSAGITLANYRGHYTMLTARTASGGGELHAHYSDFLIVLEGEGTEMTGGTMVDPKQGPNGETRGKTLEGATPHLLHKGDVIHIPSGTPHQAIEAPGQSIIIYVIKVEAPGTTTLTNTAAAR
jgi:quercetin dioxygenase-like cupin family protein